MLFIKNKAMKKNLTDSELSGENQSHKGKSVLNQILFQLMKSDGFLFILWGWISFITYLGVYITGSITYSYRISQIMNFAEVVLPVMGIIVTGIYIYIQRSKLTSNSGILLLYVWISMIIGLVLINLIQFNVMHKIIFVLQHPIFMVVIAFAIVITGSILHYKMIIAGGIVFGLLAYVSSYLALHEQLLVEAIAWLIAFIIPGHILYLKRKTQNSFFTD
jgi:hypothetical protein